MTAPGPPITDVKVEFYAGQRGDETPRAVTIAGRRLAVSRVLGRARVLDAAGGERRETWRCLLEDGRVVSIELLPDGALRVSPAA